MGKSETWSTADYFQRSEGTGQLYTANWTRPARRNTRAMQAKQQCPKCGAMFRPGQAMKKHREACR